MSYPTRQLTAPREFYQTDRAFSPPPARLPILEDGIGLDEVWRIIRSRLSLTLYLIIGTLFVTAVIVLTKTPTYTAQATLLIEPESPQVLNMTQLVSNSVGDADYDYYKTQFELLKSRALAAHVIRTLGLESDPVFAPQHQSSAAAVLFGRMEDWANGWLAKSSVKPNDALLEDLVKPSSIDHYLSHLKVEPKAGTRLVSVSFSSTDSMLAARIVNAHVREFVSLGLKMQGDQQRTARDFLKSQLIEIDKRVRDAESALNAYRQKNGVISFDVDDSDKVAAQRMADLTRALTEAETQRISAEAQMDLVKQGHFESLPEVVSNPAIASLRPQLITLEAEYARLSSAFNPSYPKLAELKAQLTQTRNAMAAEVQYVAGAIQRSYLAAIGRENELRAEVNAEKQRDLAQNNALVEDSVLSRDVEANRDLYKSVLQRMQEMTVAENTPLSNISIVESAAPPLAPSNPKKAIDLCLSGVIAGIAGLALSFLLNHLDKRLKTAEEIEEYLGLASLAIVPDFNRLSSRSQIRHALPARRPKRRRQIELAAEASSPLLEGRLAGKAEVYRAIRTGILFSRASSAPKTVLFTSSVEAEGKTWTTVNTALSFAHTGARTLLIDADLRRPQCHEMLDCENAVGLSEVLVGQLEVKAAARPIQNSFLSFLSAGSRVPNPAELLTSVKMRQVLRGLSEDYDFILIDSAPLMYASDTIGLATMVDGVVLVVGADCAKQVALRARSRLSQINARVLGAVLNRVNLGHPNYYGHSRYYFSYETLSS